MRSVNTLYVMTELGVCESRFAKGLTVDGKPVLAVLWISVQKNSLEGKRVWNLLWLRRSIVDDGAG